MSHFAAIRLKNLGLLLLSVFAMASCATAPATRSVAHAYTDKSKFAFISIFEKPGGSGAQVRLTSIGDVEGKAVRNIPQGDFTSIWNRLHAEDLARYEVKDSSAKLDMMNNYVVSFGCMPGETTTYVVPKASASPALKAIVMKIRGFNPM